MAGKLDVRDAHYTLGVTDMKCFLAILLFGFISLTVSADLTVFAASSTTDVMKELAAKHKARTGEAVRFNFAGSGALARQIDAGAPADLFVSANVAWMDYLGEKKLLQEGSRANVAKNSLVLIAPTDSSMTFEGFPANLQCRLAVGDFKSVPAGTYAETALGSMGWLDDVRGKLVQGTNVRTVLMYVERGEADAGIVYLTDAIQSDNVKVLGAFPADSHPPIVYPAACVKPAKPEARAFLDFMQSEDGKVIWKKYGFTPAMN